MNAKNPLEGLVNHQLLTFDGQLRRLWPKTLERVPSFVAQRMPPVRFYARDGSPGVPFVDYHSSRTALAQLCPSIEDVSRLQGQLIYVGFPGTSEPNASFPDTVELNSEALRFIWKHVRQAFMSVAEVDAKTPWIRHFRPHPQANAYELDFRKLRLLKLEHVALNRWQPVFALELHSIHFV
ncbi:hypothetical protein SISNIDRAFT_486362 [Sistotremastrum niveocremeum HHB9708]|uniref:Uncharacterized protein n=1 Tax=Sistotremastrum niveocremeum HHB9708 TaxID=1314777 RepID=A0A164U2M5_9AGAM|nr:hypothetical protein SISNIDRAFT_486362 [Sistotremastrum niveocremeum HHB9708]